MPTANAFNKFDLTGKTALVTGGGTGLGFAMARGLVRSGATVVIAARRADVIQQAVERLRQEAGDGQALDKDAPGKQVLGKQVLGKTVDLSDRSSTNQLAEDILSELGGIDIFVANAAQEHMQSIDEIEDEAVDRLYQINVASNILLVKKLLPHMREQQWGRVIMISSTASLQASAPEGVAVYSATKSALSSYARVAAAEAGHDGITFNSIHPGAFMTDMLKGIVEGAEPAVKDYLLNQFVHNAALGRWGEPEELEGVIQLLASNAGSYITGADIVVDGGLSMMIKPNPKV